MIKATLQTSSLSTTTSIDDDVQIILTDTDTTNNNSITSITGKNFKNQFVTRTGASYYSSTTLVFGISSSATVGSNSLPVLIIRLEISGDYVEVINDGTNIYTNIIGDLHTIKYVISGSWLYLISSDTMDFINSSSTISSVSAGKTSSTGTEIPCYIHNGHLTANGYANTETCDSTTDVLVVDDVDEGHISRMDASELVDTNTLFTSDPPRTYITSTTSYFRIYLDGTTDKVAISSTRDAVNYIGTNTANMSDEYYRDMLVDIRSLTTRVYYIYYQSSLNNRIEILVSHAKTVYIYDTGGTLITTFYYINACKITLIGTYYFVEDIYLDRVTQTIDFSGDFSDNDTLTIVNNAIYYVPYSSGMTSSALSYDYATMTTQSSQPPSYMTINSGSLSATTSYYLEMFDDTITTLSDFISTYLLGYFPSASYSNYTITVPNTSINSYNMHSDTMNYFYSINFDL